MEQIRTFVAIQLTDELKLAFTRLQEKLESGSRAPVKWVNPYSIHLTLKFLGNVNSNMVDKINVTLGEAVHGIQPFRLEAQGLGVFPNPQRVQIVWVGLTGELNRLNQLQNCVESGLANLGFVRESRRFTPHLTLARVRDQATAEERRSLGQTITSTSFKTGYILNVDSVYFMRSQLTREGPIYTQIGCVKLS